MSTLYAAARSFVKDYYAMALADQHGLSPFELPDNARRAYLDRIDSETDALTDRFAQACAMWAMDAEPLPDVEE